MREKKNGNKMQKVIKMRTKNQKMKSTSERNIHQVDNRVEIANAKSEFDQKSIEIIYSNNGKPKIIL